MPTLRSNRSGLIEVNNKYAYTFTGMESGSIITQLEDHTTLLKRDAEIRDFSLSLRYTDEKVPSLLPHWTSFIDAIRTYNPDYQFWKLNEVNLPSDIINVLQTLLVSRNIHRLDFIKSDSGSEANQLTNFSLLCNVISENTTIKCLVIKGATRFGPALYKAIRMHIALEELYLLAMELGGAESIFRSMINASVNMKYISLRDSTIGPKGAEILSEFLKSNKKLEYLCLANTLMTNEDVTLVAAALKHNTTLRVLNLGGTKINGVKNMNKVTSTGLQVLSKVLFNTSSLYWVANSNHTCRVETASRLLEPCRYEALLNIVNRKGTPKGNRRWKLLSVLYATNGIGIGDEFKTYQNLKVIPEVLAFITASFEDEELPDDEQGDVQDKENSEASPAASSIFPSLSSLFSSSSSKKDADDDSGDEISVESDESFDSYDSELDELDDAFEEEEDEAYENFDKSFVDPAFCGERARLTVMFQVVQKWGLPLLNKNPSLAEEPVAAAADEGNGKQKKRRTTSWKCEPGKKGKKSRKSTKRGFREAVISQKEIDSLAN